MGEAEKEIVRSRERLDTQGQGPSTSNEPVARENTIVSPSQDETWTSCDDFVKHIKKEVKQMKAYHSLVWYIGRGIRR